MLVPYTALTTSALGLLIAVLGLYVSFIRIQKKITFGDGDFKPLQGAIRAHANAVEHIPPVLLLMLVYELQGGETLILGAVGLGFTAFRLMHAWGMTQRQFFVRRIGAGGTYLVEVVLPILVLIQLFK